MFQKSSFKTVLSICQANKVKKNSSFFFLFDIMFAAIYAWISKYWLVHLFIFLIFEHLCVSEALDKAVTVTCV